MSDLKEKKIYKDVSYKIRTGPDENDFIELSSIYVIADGGYLDWSVIISAFGPSSNPTEYKFTDWIASVRKDVECFFGILKKRFRFLKCPIGLHSKEDIDNVYWTCCIIHNMILQFDGLDRLWEANVNWGSINPTNNAQNNNEINVGNDYNPIIHNHDTFVPTYVHDLIPESDIHSYESIEKVQHNKLKKMLANHLQIMYREGKLRWPKYRKECSNNYIANEVVRINMPNIGDLD